MELLEQMRVKAWLNQAQVGHEIAELQRSAANLQARAASVPACGHESRAAVEAARRYAQLIQERVTELQARAAAVRAVIAQVPDERERAVLVHRYVNGETWEAISDATNYCCVHLHRIHRAALSSVMNILERAPLNESDSVL